MVFLLPCFSGLENGWEEICVQVQDDRSFHWDIYEEVLNKTVAKDPSDQPHLALPQMMYLLCLDER